MKKVISSVAAVACLSVTGAAFAGILAGTGVNGSLHDMNIYKTNSNSVGSDSMGRVCVFCHTPHHAVVTSNADALPLWNHALTADDQYVPYTWATPDNANVGGVGAFAIVDPVVGPSRLCMSCHDGSIAIDEHGYGLSQAGTVSVGTISSGVDPTNPTGRGNLTKDLSTTHPIGFDYNAVQAARQSTAARGNAADDKEIVSSGTRYAASITIENTNAGTYNQVTPAASGKTIADNLYNGNIMTCATCHEVHNKENATQDAYSVYGGTAKTVEGVTMSAPNYFLYAKQTNSLICLSCHVK